MLPDFPDSLLARVDCYIELLEKLNPGEKWTRTSCIASLLTRSLAEIEGAELRWSRRRGEDRRASGRAGDERRSGPSDRRRGGDRRKPPYPDVVERVIDEVLGRSERMESRRRRQDGAPTDELSDTWRSRSD